MVKAEQEANQKQYEKEEQERKRKKEALKRKKRMLEAAFDGEIADMEAVLKEVIYKENLTIYKFILIVLSHNIV